MIKFTVLKGKNDMKKAKIMIVSLMLLTLIFSMIPTASATFDRSYSARYGSPYVDGVIDAEWDSADEWTTVDKPYEDRSENGGKPLTDSEVKVKMLWDESGLYFLAQITDNDYSEANDIFEIYLDQTNTKSSSYGSDDSQTRFMLKGEVVTGVHAGKNAQTTAEFKVTKEGENVYIMEGQLSWTAGIPSAGHIMGLEFMYGDGVEAQSAMVEAYRWNIDQPNGDKAAWESTAHWGTLVLADEDGEVPLDPPAPLTAAPTEPPATEPPETTRPPITGKPKDTTAATTTADNTAEPSSESTLPVGAIIGIAAAAAVVIGVVVVIVIKKKQ